MSVSVFLTVWNATPFPFLFVHWTYYECINSLTCYGNIPTRLSAVNPPSTLAVT